MIMKPNNWDSVQAPTGYTLLPAGGYVIRISDAQVLASERGYEYIDMTIDIEEGEFTGYYSKDYYNQNGADKKYRGHYRQGTPKNGDGAARYFKGMVQAIEESNPGYTWNWDEKSLVGRVVGCLFREEEYTKANGDIGVRVSPAFVCSADRIRKGDFTIPQRKKVQQQTGGYGQQPQNNMYADMMPAPGEAYNNRPW